MMIDVLKASGLRGRSGSGFPTWLKWENVQKARQTVGRCFVVCNGAEGEPAVFKDKYILEKYPEEVVNGVKVAMGFLQAEKGYIYLRRPYYKKFKRKLEKIIGSEPIKLVAEVGGYLSGEETALLNSIEGGRPEARKRPPYPSKEGLFGLPTLVNNVETFYCVSKISRREYQNKKFYCVSGAVRYPGVYELPESLTVKQVLVETKNLPEFKSLIQVGGGASGGINFLEELDGVVEGAASIFVYNYQKINLKKLLKKLVDFFETENCGQCVPCREGVYRLKEMVDGRVDFDFSAMRKILDNLAMNSFCPFGRGVAVSVGSLVDKIDVKK